MHFQFQKSHFLTHSKQIIDLCMGGCHIYLIGPYKEDAAMLNDEHFRETLEKLMYYPDSFSKEELHLAFLEMTVRYLDEMVMTMNYEKAITAGMSKEAADNLIEQVSTSNPCIDDLDRENASASDIKEVIENLLIYTGFELEGFNIGDEE